jgi:hypothetical protein
MIPRHVLRADTILTGDGAVAVMGLPVRHVAMNGAVFKVSAWEPAPVEFELIRAGHPVLLWVCAPQHPVVAMSVGYPPEWEEQCDGILQL